MYASTDPTSKLAHEKHALKTLGESIDIVISTPLEHYILASVTDF